MSNELMSAGYRRFFGVPCGVLAPLLEELSQPKYDLQYAPREDTAVGVAAGSVLTGEPSVVIMQNSGLGQSVNALASLIVPYRIPLALIVSLRGTAPDNTVENAGMGVLSATILDGLRLPNRVLSDIAADVGWLWQRTSEGQPAALLVTPVFFGWDSRR
jgi:sulfopyruvate decarboxylase TPP-binding subunit